ncbi:hypothetical protein E2542_SST10134 [Spatholobus suberectus]|nr:hypothetical protein E2542_SST10134 [Spatholobus suberectus]
MHKFSNFLGVRTSIIGLELRLLAFCNSSSSGAGEMAKVVEERSRKSEKEKRVACFIFQLLSQACNGFDDSGRM